MIDLLLLYHCQITNPTIPKFQIYQLNLREIGVEFNLRKIWGRIKRKANWACLITPLLSTPQLTLAWHFHENRHGSWSKADKTFGGKSCFAVFHHSNSLPLSHLKRLIVLKLKISYIDFTLINKEKVRKMGKYNPQIVILLKNIHIGGPFRLAWNPIFSKHAWNKKHGNSCHT